VPLHCTLQQLQAYIQAASGPPNASVKTIINNDQFKCLRLFVTRDVCDAHVERIF